MSLSCDTGFPVFLCLYQASRFVAYQVPQLRWRENSGCTRYQIPVCEVDKGVFFSFMNREGGYKKIRRAEWKRAGLGVGSTHVSGSMDMWGWQGFPFQHFMNRGGCTKMGTSEQEGSLKWWSDEPLGPRVRSTDHYGYWIHAMYRRGALTCDYCWNSLISNQRLRCWFSLLQITCIFFLLF